MGIIVSNKALAAKRYCFVAFETMRNCHTFLISLVLCIVIKSSSTRYLLVEVEKENDRENTQTKARDRVCCKANTAECHACSLGMTLEEYCTENPDTIGCFRDIVVTNGSLESVPHPQPKWLAIEGAEDC